MTSTGVFFTVYQVRELRQERIVEDGFGTYGAVDCLKEASHRLGRLLGRGIQAVSFV